MNIPRLSLLGSSLLVVPLALLVGAAGPVAAEPPSTTFGSHVSSCAPSSGFNRLMNPSHHRGPSGHSVDDMHC